eukprot:scaffold54944_cov69-Phaeocystis_antarctica.AAC.2
MSVPSAFALANMSARPLAAAARLLLRASDWQPQTSWPTRLPMRSAPPMIVHLDGASPMPTYTHTGPRMASSGWTSPTSADEA